MRRLLMSAFECWFSNGGETLRMQEVCFSYAESGVEYTGDLGGEES